MLKAFFSVALVSVTLLANSACATTLSQSPAEACGLSGDCNEEFDLAQNDLAQKAEQVEEKIVALNKKIKSLQGTLAKDMKKREELQNVIDEQESGEIDEKKSLKKSDKGKKNKTGGRDDVINKFKMELSEAKDEIARLQERPMKIISVP